MRARTINSIIHGMDLGLRAGDHVWYKGHELVFTHLGWYTGHAYFNRVGYDQEVCLTKLTIGKIERRNYER